MISAVIVAAGRGTRMGPQVDKLLLEVAGLPVVGHAWRLLDGHASISEVVLVVREDLESAIQALGRRLPLQKPHRIVRGGKERQDSVWNGLEALGPEVQWVAIHDGARPCTSPAAVAATLFAAQRRGAAVTAQRVTDTLKESDATGAIVRTVDRSRLWAVQTPQVFRVDVIRRALGEVRQRGLVLTDDTAACELVGQEVELVESREPNPKVTVPADLAYVGWLLSARAPGETGPLAKQA